ncbi:MAG: sulfite exporter TauE/SafE family protein [Anaerolineae bacterium]|nr:sulfite exporter TauE/SafE family protein [Anaerolineae bacterium]
MEAQVQWYILLVLGLGAGVLSGMFGIGGGVIIVPALVALLHFDQKQAVGTSLAALLLPVSLGAVISYYQSGLLDLVVAVLVALGLVGGAFAGAKIALSLPSVTVKRLYGIFLLFVALRFIFF